MLSGGVRRRSFASSAKSRTETMRVKSISLARGAMLLALSVPVQAQQPEVPTLRSFIANLAIERRFL